MNKLQFLIQPKGVAYDPIAVEFPVNNTVLLALYANNKDMTRAVYMHAYELAGYGPVGVIAGMFVPALPIAEGVAVDYDPSYTYDKFQSEFAELCAARL